MGQTTRRLVKRMIVIMATGTFLFCPQIRAQAEEELVAFPGAEGAGKFTEGGRGGDVYPVTSLEDAGPGTLRDAIESARGPRTIVFDVAGTIRLKSKLVIDKKSRLTIAGQTAPGKGITLADQCLQIDESSHIIVRYLRVRLGDENKPQGEGPDCITVEHSDHIMLDHLSLSWGIDGNGDFRGLSHVTLQWLIFSEALHDSLHGKGPHAMCSSYRDGKGPATMHHNIYASSRSRHPTINGGPAVVEFCNNLDYNWQKGHNLSGDKLNLLGNYYRAGPSMHVGFKPIQFKSGNKPPTSRGYLRGNHFKGLPGEFNADNYLAMDYKASGLGFGHDHNYQDTSRADFEVSRRFDAGKYKLTQIQSADQAYQSCLKYSGCSLVRDTVDERFIKTIVENTGRIIDSQNDVGGWDSYAPIRRPNNWDTDQDGMPDHWEKTRGLDPEDPKDRNGDKNSDGYTNLEAYLSSLCPAAMTSPTSDNRRRDDIAETLLLYQRANGGWPKNFEWKDKLSDTQKKRLLSQKHQSDTTIDNSATRDEVRYLAKAYGEFKDDRYRLAAVAGIRFLLAAQYDNGGWPQYYPNARGYATHITFNDNAMVGVMSLFRDIVQGRPEFAFVDDRTRERMATAIERGIDCILKCQITVNGRKTVWCAQHDEKTLKPRKARSYELASLSGAESVNIVRFLMAIDDPKPEVIEAIEAAVTWFDQVKIEGQRIQRIEDASQPGGRDRIVVQDPTAPPLWGRFYQIETMRPIFCSRDGIPKYNLSEISHERRNGYSWLGGYAQDLLNKDYPAWKKRLASRK